MVQHSLFNVLEGFFQDHWPLVAVRHVDVDVKAQRWNIALCAPQPVAFSENHLGEVLREAFPFLSDVHVAREFPAQAGEVCPIDTLSRLVHERVGGEPADFTWSYQSDGSIRVETRTTASKRFEAKLREAVAEITGVEAQLDVLHADARGGELLFGRALNQKTEPEPISSLNEESSRVVIEGFLFGLNYRATKYTRKPRGGGAEVPMSLVIFNITDGTSSITVKRFDTDTVCQELASELKEGDRLRLRGDCEIDKYRGELTIKLRDVERLPKIRRADHAPRKRVELHLHTTMSSMDAFCSIEDTIAAAAAFGHKALAITDHGVVQAFPDAAQAARGKLKLILGVEAYMIGEDECVVADPKGQGFKDSIVVLDLETTGLNAAQCGITEIGAVRMRAGSVVEQFQTFVNPGMPIPANIVHLTGITDDMVADAPGEGEALQKLADFIGDDVVAAHNAEFDMGFLRTRGRLYRVAFRQTVLDTLQLSRGVFPDMKRHRLDTMCRKLNIRLEGHHRAVNDAQATAILMQKLLDMAAEAHGIDALEDLNRVYKGGNLPNRDYHTILLAQNKEGLKNLYKLISISHLDHFKTHPRMPRSLIEAHREGLIVGSACEKGEIFSAVLAGDMARARKAAAFYDYLEIQPDGNNMFLIRNGRLSGVEELHEINRNIVALAQEQNKPVVATGDVHFLNPEDEYFRRIIQAGQNFDDADEQPPLFYRTTDEMLDEFAYLGEEMAEAVVIDNPEKIADSIEEVEPLPPYRLYAPNIEGAEEFIVERSWERAREMYGDPLPEIVRLRLEKELGAITKYEFSVLFYIAHKLVKKSLDDDYLVGSRGSVGSSLVATMTDITEVNPLPPHYRCPACKFSDFDIDETEYATGPDLPERDCPQCGERLIKDGFSILFEVFLGFEGDKVPDIDLNFSGEYQPTMHKYTEELFGEGNVFRAGTISTIAERTAFGFVKNYLQDRGINAPQAEIDRLTRGCSGVRRTTGQHPGGIIVVPKEYEIYDFCPIQHPADDKESGVITTHFDFNSLHDRLVKLDILGHDDPTMLRMLKDLTGIDPRTIPLDDPDTMSLFCGTGALGVTPEEIMSNQGTYGVPEFGTGFVRGMLEETKPKTMGELIRISGLSHGTDVWLNNAQSIIRAGTATLREAVCARDDIMNYLIRMGVESKMAFNAMESVRKGKGLSADMEKAMMEASVPDWYIDSCKKIKYLFPKAHAAAYVVMGFRVAWYKVHYPKEYYAAYYTVRADDFDASIMLGDIPRLRQTITALNAADDAKQKEKKQQVILEIVLEMRCRGIQFTAIDLYQSDPVKFLITDDGRIRPPLNALPGLGDTAARRIAQEREQEEFISEENLKQRTGISVAVLDVLREYRCLGDMRQTNQVSLFDLM